MVWETPPPTKTVLILLIYSSERTNPWTGEKAIEFVWFHLVAIEAIWATGQLTTKIKFAIETVWFFLKHFEFFFFLVVGYLVMSWHQAWDISNQPLLSFQRAVLSQLSCTQRVCETFWDFDIRKWPLNFSQKIAWHCFTTCRHRFAWQAQYFSVLHLTLHTPHFTLHFTLHPLHCTRYTPHCTLHTLHFRLHTLHFTLHTPHSTLHTPHFTL